MEFGKRFSMHNDRTPKAVQQTCVRCCGTGRVRESGNRLVCQTCAGSGRTAVAEKRTA
jgi:hypothetical protein